MKLSNPFKSFSPPHTFFKSLHQRDVLLSKPLYANPRHPRYLESNKSHHKFPLPSSKSLLHFPSNALLKSLMSFTPNPPWFWGQHIWFQLTQTIFILSSSPPQRKFLWMEINLCVTIWEAFKKNKGKRLVEKRGPRYWGISSREMISAYVSTLSTSY